MVTTGSCYATNQSEENKLRNALILATAIVMFAVPLNFAVEISANYISDNTKAPETFDDFSSYI